MGKKVFLIDVAKCSGCQCCQVACKDEHCGNDWPPFTRTQPDTGQFWIKVNENVCGTRPKVKIHYIPTLCNHCDDPACIKAAENGAVYKRADGLVIIDPEKAAGQKQIMEACPYGAIYWNEELNIPQKCTGCAHLLDSGAKVPRCVENCPHDAIVFGDEEELRDHILGASMLKPELGLHPNVFYRNIPGQFIAGTVYDPIEKEVVIGARVRAVTGGKVYKTVTNQYGDFWFEDLAIGFFDVYIEQKGYKERSFIGLHTVECINLGDIPLERAAD